MPEVSPQIRRGLIALSAVLVLIGMLGAFTIDDSPTKRDLLADGAATTTTSPAEVDDSSDVSITVPTIGNTPSTAPASRPATTAKANSPATTAKPGAAACSSAPAGAAPTTANPAPAKPPAPGNYIYESATSGDRPEPCKAEQTRIAAGTDSDGVVRRTSTEQTARGQRTEQEAWAADAMRQERFVIESSGGSIECDWNPDPVILALPLSVGKTWSVDSSCDATGAPIPFTIRIEGTGKVTGKISVLVGGVRANTWVIESTIKVTTTGNQSFDQVGTTYFEPGRGLVVYSKSVLKNEDGQATVERRLTNLNPA